MKAKYKAMVGTYILDPRDPDVLRFVELDGNPRGQMVNPVWVRQELQRRQRMITPDYTLDDMVRALNVPLVHTEVGTLDAEHLPDDHPDRRPRQEHTPPRSGTAPI